MEGDDEIRATKGEGDGAEFIHTEVAEDIDANGAAQADCTKVEKA